MITQLRYCAAALLLLAGCGENDSEVFYTVDYPILRVEAEVTLTDPDPDPNPNPNPDPDPDPNPDPDPTPEPAAKAASQAEALAGGPAGGFARLSPSGFAAPSGEAEDALIDRLEAEIVAASPVQAGGKYRLAFSKYNGGRVRIDTATDAGEVIGAFFKTPGTDEILIYCPEPEFEYLCTLSSYRDEAGLSKVVLVTDLTEAYRTLYPDAGITKAELRQFTSTREN